MKAITLTKWAAESMAFRGIDTWFSEKSYEDMVNLCERGDWLLWMASREHVDIKKTDTSENAYC